jgi:hypothetical protein
MRLPVSSPKVRTVARRLEKVIAISLIVAGAGWALFEFAAQYVYLRPEFREPQPALGYIWATPMKGRYAYLSHIESLLEIYMPTAWGLFLVGALWLDRIRKRRERE